MSGNAVAHLRDRISRDALVTRRDYLRLLVTVSGRPGGGHGRRGGRRVPPPRRGHARAHPGRRRRGAGRAVAFSYPEDDPALAVRLADGTLVGYSSVCTHLACGVIWRAVEGDLYCPATTACSTPAPARRWPGPPAAPAEGAPKEDGEGDLAVGSA